MFRFLLILMSMLLTSNLMMSQSNDKLWKEVKKYIEDGKPASASNLVDEIYAQARASNDYDEIIKSLYYKNNLKAELEEDHEAKSIARYETYYNQESDPIIKAILANSIGQRYLNYLQNYGWRQQERTSVQVEEDGDILTYSNAKLIDKSNNYFILSLDNKDDLKKIKAEDIPSIMFYEEKIHGEDDLYLILSMDLIRNFQNSNNFITTSNTEFKLNQKKLFGNIDEFLSINFDENISFHKKKFIAILLQELLNDYGSNSEFSLIKINIERLRFMNSYAEGQNIEGEEQEQLTTQYRRVNALEDFLMEKKSSKHAEMIEYELMNAYMIDLPFNIHSVEKRPNQQDNLKKVLPIVQKLRKSDNDAYKGQAYDANTYINKKELMFNNEMAISPHKEALMYVSYRNITQAGFRIISVDNDTYSKIQSEGNVNRFLSFQKFNVVAEWTEDLPKADDHIAHSIELIIPSLPVGQYVILAYDGSSFSTSKLVHGSRLHVSKLSYHFMSANGQHQLVVMDRESGEPIPEAKVESFMMDYDRSQRRSILKPFSDGITDEDGIVEIKANARSRNNIQFKVTKGNDFLQLENRFAYLSKENKRRPRQEIIWFTDRAIYRPGQIVHYKGILMNVDNQNYPKLGDNEKLDIYFKDANYQDIETQKINTDEYGSFYGSFVIPTTGLNGNFSLSANGVPSRKNIKIEEYKRPTFKPKFEDSFAEYKLGDTVKIKAIAKTYAGIKMEGAKYKYTIYRQSYWPWYRTYFYCGYYPLPQNGRSIVTSKEGIVEEDAMIPIEFYAAYESNSQYGGVQPSYHFTIELELIDINGETQADTKQLSLSEKPFQIIAKHESHLPKGEDVEMNVEFKNFDNQTIKRTAELVFSKIELQQTYFKSKLWDFPEFHKQDSVDYKKMFPDELYSINEHPYQQKKGKTIKEVKFDTSEGSKVKVDGLKNGFYLVQIKLDGELSDYQSYLQIFDGQIEGISELKVVGIKGEYEIDQKAEFQFVDNHKNSNVLFSLFQKNELQSRMWIRTGKEQKINIDRDAYGNLILKGLGVRNNRVFEVTQIIHVPWKNKDLEIEYISFRDKILPGAQEEYTLSVKPIGKESAQLTLGMYDASLDAFVENNWRGFNYPLYNFISESSVNSFGSNGSQLLSKYDNAYYNVTQQKLFPSFKFSEQMYSTYATVGYGVKRNLKVRGSRNEATEYAIDGVQMAEASAPMMDQEMANTNWDAAGAAKEQSLEQQADKGIDDKAPPIRKNLEETVFFYPNLTTDSNGELSYTFEMKEAITQWKLLSFAHNKEGQFAYDQRTLITQKNLLIQANMPRFLRAGDQINFTSKVSNLSEGPLEGIASIEILDAITEESVSELMITNEISQAFSLIHEESEVINWTLDIPEDFIMPVIVRVYAKAGKHTDGEQNMLSVLTNRRMITATKSMMLRPNSKNTFEFEHLLENFNAQSLESHSYQIEFTSNPVWFAIKAMPYLNSIDPEYTTRLTDQLFANTLSSSIIKKYPIIKSVFEQWKNDPEALRSELEKNKELKEVLLKETPWVRQSQSEAQQRRDIALLFEINQLSNQLKSSLNQLVQRQDSNGGFSWRKGGRDSWHVTQYVIEQLVKMKYLDLIQDPVMDQIIVRGMNYLDMRVEEHYKKISKSERKTKYLSAMMIQYSYIQSMYQKNMFGNISAAAKSYFKKAFEENWTSHSPYMQSMIALSHYRAGETKLGLLIEESLLERVIKSEQLGAYWKANNAFSWHGLAIEQQATMIEFFEELGTHKDLVAEMKMWLLSKKQTTHWPTTKSTAAAIFALLNNSGTWIEENKQIEVWIGNDKVDIDKQESGTGQFAVNYDKGTINESYAEIKVNNPNDYLIWGSAYWQYWQDLDQIAAADENPFTIIKEVFKSVTNEDENKLIKLDNETNLEQGDKLTVRIELRTDRDLDYVHMQDMRAAGLEPLNVLSNYKYQDGMSYYETTKDQFTDFFFERLDRGTYVFEYQLRVTHRGQFSNGVTTAQCLYAPSFAGHSEGQSLKFD